MPATFWKANDQVIGIYDLMIERYGFSIAYPEMELTHSNYLVYGETGNYDIWIFLFWNADGLISINFWIPDYYREEALETWEGDIDSYLYNPNHWVNVPAVKEPEISVNAMDGEELLWVGTATSNTNATIVEEAGIVLTAGTDIHQNRTG